MINLLKFRQPDGAEYYARYGEQVQPHLQRVGAEVVYAGPQLQMVIGADSRPWWDLILVVRYPSPQAFMEMVADPDYQVVHQHRVAALERAELIATAPGLEL
jgi:uncharacterized protein (DUF1330 family)